MELVLPMSYVELKRKEVMYLDGGTWQTFKKNIIGLVAGFAVAAIGWTLWNISFY